MMQPRPRPLFLGFTLSVHEGRYNLQVALRLRMDLRNRRKMVQLLKIHSVIVDENGGFVDVFKSGSRQGLLKPDKE